jgi:hypothetical protein
MRATAKDGSHEEYSGFLNEFVVHYLATKTILNSDLSAYSLPYATAREMANFEAILQQSNISDEELIHMHRNSDIRGFLLKITKAARKENPLDTERAYLGFGMELFDPLLFRGKSPYKTLARRAIDYFDNVYLTAESAEDSIACASELQSSSN